MNPPPRKVKPAVALKNTQSDQTAKLQAKHQQECDLLEDIRTFFRQKAALEKEYAQGLLKVTAHLLKRDFPAQPDIASEDGLEHKTVTTVWRHILEETDRQAKARLQAAEIYAEMIAEPLKAVKSGKQQCTKKVMPQLGVLHGEVSGSVMEMIKAHKVYSMEETTAHDARQKVTEVEDRIKRKSTGLFQSMAGLQKTYAKLQSRKESCEMRSTAARNEYLLALAASNAHQLRFYKTDLLNLMTMLDCDIYEKIQEYLTRANSLAADISRVEANTFATIAEEAEKISQQFSLQCYLFQNQVFTNLVQYQFDPCQDDQCSTVSTENGAKPELQKEARKCASRVAKETRLIHGYRHQLTQLHSTSLSTSVDQLSVSSQEGDCKSNGGVVDLEQKREHILQNIRRAETSKMKAEARLEALRLAGIEVDEWLNQAQIDSLTADENGTHRTSSQMSLHTSSDEHSLEDQEPTYTHYDDDDDDDFVNDTFNENYGGTASSIGRPFPVVCTALYDFEASNCDELSIKQEEQLTLIAEGDGEGWVKARNASGHVGYIPLNYMDLSEDDASAKADVVASELHFRSPSPPTVLAVSEVMVAPPPQLVMPGSLQSQAPYLPPSPLQCPGEGDAADTTSPFSSGDLEVQQTTDDMTEDGTFPPPPLVPCAGQTWARALYDYEAQTQEELSFVEGAMIQVLRKDDNGVDDGYWEGELNGHCGVFPSLLVEEVTNLVDDQVVLEDALPSPMTEHKVPSPVTSAITTAATDLPHPPLVFRNDAVSCRKTRRARRSVRMSHVNPSSFESAV